MTILFHPWAGADAWLAAFARELPDTPVVVWPDVPEPDQVEYLVAWMHDWTDVARYPNLRAVLVTGAGFDHVDLDAVGDVPVVRLVDPAMAVEMAEYCVHWVCHYARGFDRYLDPPDRSWTPRPHRQATVGILGLGEIGTVVAEAVHRFRYPVISWSRSAKETPFGRHYHGAELHEFLAACDVVINLLPNNAHTEGLLDSAAFGAMGAAVFINIGRGPTVVDDALLNALDASLRAAVLDVFDVEPLPADSPLWDHPRVVITPHVAGATNPDTAAAVMADNIRRIRRGENPFPLVPR